MKKLASRTGWIGLAPLWVALFGAFAAWAAPAAAGIVYPGEEWAVRSPEEAGLDPAGLEALAELVGGSGMVVHNGYLVHEWGDLSHWIDWRSASKPVIATCLWMAVEDNLCQLDSTVGEFLEGGTPEDRAITFHDLSNMISGYGLIEPPGEAWAYNDYAVNLLGEVLFVRAHGSLPSVVIPDRLAPLGFRDPILISDTQKGRIKRMSVRDFARIGLLWLSRGIWDGDRLLADAHFDLVDNQVPPWLPLTAGEGSMSWDFGTFGGPRDQLSWGQGHYGFAFWVNTNGLWPGVPADAFQANGSWGRTVCTVIPSLGLVVAGDGDWGHPSSEPLRILAGSVSGVAVEETTWGRIKTTYR